MRLALTGLYHSGGVFIWPIVVSGISLVGLRNEPLHIIKAGDIVWIPPDEEHWHGATASNSMTHIAIQEALNGHVAKWLEKVSDEDYSGLAE